MNIQDYYSNRLNNTKNSYQGDYPRVLAVCSAGLLRSATIGWVLGKHPYNCNTRAVGVDKTYGLIIIDQVLIEWADHIVFAQQNHLNIVKEEFSLAGQDGNLKRIWVLDIPDKYGYRDTRLVKIIRKSIERVGLGKEITGKDY